MRSVKVVVSCLMLGTMAGGVMAQEEQPRRRPQRDQQPGERPARDGDRQPGDRPAREGQPGERGPRGQLSPEKLKAAWELQAKSVGARLGLDDAKTAALVKAYQAGRESHNAARQKLMSEMRDAAGEDGGREGMEAMREKMETMNASEKAKLEKSVSAAIGADHTGKAMASLGTFNMQWDRMTDTVAGFGLDAAKQKEAMGAIETFVIATGKAQGLDREEGMSIRQEARKALSDAMKKTLSEEQFGRFEASMGGGGRMGGGPGGPGGGGGGGEDRPRRRGGGGGGGGL